MRNVESVRRGFAVLEDGSALQTAVNEHGSSEQVLFVVRGALEAEIDGERFAMGPGDSVVVGKNAPHRFVNRSKERALTFNVYAPKAY